MGVAAQKVNQNLPNSGYKLKAVLKLTLCLENSVFLNTNLNF